MMITGTKPSMWLFPLWISTVVGFPGTLIIPEVAMAELGLSSLEESRKIEIALDQGVPGEEAMAQITSVSQLSDVQPTDWAFQALQSLVERYGCISGYPDSTFRGQRALTRFEFAAGLNACLDQINQIIQTALGDQITASDIAVLQRLQEEFMAELSELRGRVDHLERETNQLETAQFSTTTKLYGLGWLTLTGAGAADGLRVETADLNTSLEIRPAGRHSISGSPLVQRVTDNPEITFSELLWLTFATSFSGQDQLITTLAMGNGNSPANVFASSGFYNTVGTPFIDQSAGPNVGSTEIILRELFYQFPVGNALSFVVGPRINFYRHFDVNLYTSFFNSGVSFNSVNTPLITAMARGAGIVGLWQMSDHLRLHFGYLGENQEFLPGAFFNSAGNPQKGLFGATNQFTTELTYSPSQRANLRFAYSWMNQDNNVPVFDEMGNVTGFGVGAGTAGPLLGVVDDGFGGSIRDSIGHAFGVNFDWRLSSQLALFGRYTYGITHINPKRSDRRGGQVNAQYMQLGVAFPDLGKPGALGTFNVVVPFDVLDGRKFLVSGGGNGGREYDLEASYYYPITEGIAINPSVYWILNPNNFDNNPSIVVGTMRAQFSF